MKKLPGALARDNLAQDGQRRCPWLDSLILAHADQFGMVENMSDNFLPMFHF